MKQGSEVEQQFAATPVWLASHLLCALAAPID